MLGKWNFWIHRAKQIGRTGHPVIDSEEFHLRLAAAGKSNYHPREGLPAPGAIAKHSMHYLDGTRN